MQPYAMDGVSLGSAEERYDSDMTHSYRLTEGRLIRYPLIRSETLPGVSLGIDGADSRHVDDVTNAVTAL